MNCDVCNAPMNKSTHEYGASFKCSKCQQSWSVNGDNVRCTILKTLWQKMDENGRMFREEYLPDWLRGHEYHADLFLEAGTWNEARATAYKAQARSTYEQWFKDHPLPRPWWQFWKKAD